MNSYEAILRAIKQGLDSKAAKLLELNYDGISLYHKEKLFEESIKREMHHTMKIIITCGMFDPSFNNNHVIKYASRNGHEKVVKLLLFDGRVDRSSLIVDPSANANYAIRLASKNGHEKVVKLLLSDERVDPSANYNFAIRFASQNGHEKVVELLLSDKRVDPSASNNYAIKRARQFGHEKVVELLLSDKRVRDTWKS